MSHSTPSRGREALPPLPPMPLSRTARVGLLALRLFLLLVTAMAVFTAFHGSPA